MTRPMATLDDWTRAAASATIETGLFIEGKFRPSVSGETFSAINPATGKTTTQMACGSAADIDAAVASAKSAWDDGRWRHMLPRQRMAIFARFADLVEAHAHEFALLESLAMGKPVTDALSIDIPETVVTIRYFGECIDKVAGIVSNSAHDAVHMVSREPLGVVGAISAWNYPLLMATWKVAPALAAGNCVVLKPAEQAPFSCLKLPDCSLRRGVPRACSTSSMASAQSRGKHSRCIPTSPRSASPDRPQSASS